jgi:hypothetical protein
MSPEMVPAPAVELASIVNTTALPDAPPVAASVIGEVPNGTGEEGAAEVIDCAINAGPAPVADPVPVLVLESVAVSVAFRVPPPAGVKVTATG